MVRITKDYRNQLSTWDPETLEGRMNTLAENPSEYSENRKENILCEFLTALDIGYARTLGEDGTLNEWVKQGVLSTFRYAENFEQLNGSEKYHDNLTTRATEGFEKENIASFEDRGIRNIDNTTMRAGCYMGEDSSIMAHGFVNIGAYIGEGTMIDGHATAGTCSYIGPNSHIGDGATVGGVLDPIEKKPVYIGKEVTLGAGSRVTQGMKVGDNVEIAENTVLNPAITVYHADNNSGDLVIEKYQGEVPSNTKVFQRYTKSESYTNLVDEEMLKPVALAISKDLEGIRDDLELRDELRDF